MPPTPTPCPPSTTRWRRASTSRLLPLLLALAITSTSACSSQAPPPARTPLPPPSTATLVGWALGPDERGDDPGTADAYLLLLPRGKPIESGTRVTSECLGATSILPGPVGDPRIFLIIKNALHLLPKPGAKTRILANSDPSLRLTRLLAFHAAASPLQILATAEVPGETEEQTWTLTVSNDAILRAERVTDDKKPRSAAAFFEIYNSPRCLPGGTRCLVVTQSGAQKFIDVQANRSSQLSELQALGDVDVRDVARVPGQEAAMYLLIGCE